jgi:hypothetical protein
MDAFLGGSMARETIEVGPGRPGRSSPGFAE